jgi:hypothetical protein
MPRLESDYFFEVHNLISCSRELDDLRKEVTKLQSQKAPLEEAEDAHQIMMHLADRDLQVVPARLDETIEGAAIRVIDELKARIGERRQKIAELLPAEIQAVWEMMVERYTPEHMQRLRREFDGLDVDVRHSHSTIVQLMGLAEGVCKVSLPLETGHPITPDKLEKNIAALGEVAAKLRQLA